jgi:hypothetical protein
MKLALILAVALLLVAGLFWIQFRRASASDFLMPESLYQVRCDDAGVSVTDPKGGVNTIQWSRLTRVGVRTTDEGPANPDVFWEFFDDRPSPSVVFPGGATGETECLAALQSRLAGFRNDQLIRAMTSAQNAYFVVWESPGSETAK